MGLLGNYCMQGVAPADEALLFRQKCPKPFPPVCGPKGVPPPPYRIKMVRELAEPVLSPVEGLKQPSPRSRFGAPAPPHPRAGGQQNKEWGSEWGSGCFLHNIEVNPLNRLCEVWVFVDARDNTGRYTLYGEVSA